MKLKSGTFQLHVNEALRPRVKNALFSVLRPRLHEQIKLALFAQIHPELLHTDREFEQLKVTLFAHVNKAPINWALLT